MTILDETVEQAAREPSDAEIIRCASCDDPINLRWVHCAWCGEKIPEAARWEASGSGCPDEREITQGKCDECEPRGNAQAPSSTQRQPGIVTILPDCMMPDGGDPCKGYAQLRDDNEKLRRAAQRLEARGEISEAKLSDAIVAGCQELTGGKCNWPTCADLEWAKVVRAALEAALSGKEE